MSKEIFVRLAFEDIVVSKEDNEKISKYITIPDDEGEYLTDTCTYFVGYEDEDGNECDEDGNVY